MQLTWELQTRAAARAATLDRLGPNPTSRRVLGWLLFAGTGVVAAFAADALGVPMEKLTADPATVPGTSHFRGGISNFGLMIWAVSGAVLLLAGMTLARGARVDRRWPAFLTVTGVGVLLLGIDDAYLIHEDVIPHHLGIDEKFVYVVYAALLATYAARFLREIWATNVTVLGVAALSLSLSVGLDAVTHLDGAEEYFKYAGLVCLGVWSVMTAAEALVPRRSTIADASG